jgi:antitoxin (DNA-binding transcriptional repressor) of toxin-antitoxin stability system
MTRVTATEAARSFSDLINRAVYRNESFEVERGGQVVLHLIPAPRKGGTLRDLLELYRNRAPDPEFADAIEAAHAWGNAETPGGSWER